MTVFMPAMHLCASMVPVHKGAVLPRPSQDVNLHRLLDTDGMRMVLTTCIKVLLALYLCSSHSIPMSLHACAA